MTIRKTAVTGLKIVFVVAIFWALFATGRLDPGDDLRLAEGGGALVALSALFMIVLTTVGVLRWHLLLRGAGAGIPFGASMRLGWIGMFFNAFMPGAFGGDIVKLVYVVHETRARAGAAASIVVDRLCGLVGLLLVAGTVILVFWNHVAGTPAEALALALFGILGGLGLCLLSGFIALTAGRATATGLLLLLAIAQCATLGIHLDRGGFDGALFRAHALAVVDIVAATATAFVFPSLMPGRGLERLLRGRLPFGEKIMSVIEALLAYRGHPRTILAAVLSSVLVQGLALGAIAAISKAVGNAASVSQVYFAAPIALITNAIPVTPGGIGVGESAYDALLRMCRTPAGAVVTGGASVFLAFRILLNLTGLIVGAPLYIRGKKEIDEYAEEMRVSDGDDGHVPDADEILDEEFEHDIEEAGSDAAGPSGKTEGASP